MAKKLRYKKNKRGLSTIVVTLLLIVMSLVAVGVVWTFANSLIQKQISNSQSCFGVSDKFKLNGQYTCYNQGSSAPYTYSLRFSLSIGDINVDKLIIGVTSSAGTSQTYALTNTLQSINGLTYYTSGGSPAVQVKLPDKNAGLTYITTNSFTDIPNSIKIAPVISGTQCEMADSISDIQNCVYMG